MSASSLDNSVRREVEPMDFCEEYYEWIMKHYDGGHKDLYIGLFDDGWRFDDFLEELHPDCVSG